MVSIIIPHHTEDKHVMRGLMTSIDAQLSVNFNDLEIIIVNDDPECVLSYEEYENIKDRIVQYDNPVPGYPGTSRQIGINNAKGEWLLFCDADDQLYSSLSLCSVMQAAANPQYDVYNFGFIHEILTKNNTFVYKRETTSSIWVFARLIKRQFLIDNNVGFSEQTKWHEDTFFNGILELCKPKTQRIDDVIYIWRFNRNSVTREHEFDYYFSALPQLINANDKMIEWAMSQQKVYPLQNLINFIVTMYIYCNHPDQGKLSKYKRQIEDCLADLILKYDAAKALFVPEARGIIQVAMAAVPSRVPYFPIEGFEEFIKRIIAQREQK